MVWAQTGSYTGTLGPSYVLFKYTWTLRVCLCMAPLAFARGYIHALVWLYIDTRKVNGPEFLGSSVCGVWGFFRALSFLPKAGNVFQVHRSTLVRC